VTRPARVASLVAIVTVAAAVVFHGRVLAGVAGFMSDGDPLARADAILALTDSDRSPFAAADLYRRGYAPQVLVARTRATRLEAAGLLPPRSDVWRRVLMHEGVPASAIAMVGRDLRDAVGVGRTLSSPPLRYHRIIVVVFAPLCRIARADLRRGAASAPLEFVMHPVESDEFDRRTWWKSPHGVVTYFDSYVLWVLRFVRS